MLAFCSPGCGCQGTTSFGIYRTERPPDATTDYRGTSQPAGKETWNNACRAQWHAQRAGRLRINCRPANTAWVGSRISRLWRSSRATMLLSRPLRLPHCGEEARLVHLMVVATDNQLSQKRLLAGHGPLSLDIPDHSQQRLVYAGGLLRGDQRRPLRGFCQTCAQPFWLPSCVDLLGFAVRRSLISSGGHRRAVSADTCTHKAADAVAS